MFLDSASSFEEVFVWVFEQIRLEARRNILDVVNVFSVRGNFSRVVSPNFVKKLLRDVYNKFVVRVFGSGAVVRNQFDELSRVAEQVADRVSSEVSAVAKRADSVSDVLAVADRVTSSVNVWTRTEEHGIVEAARFEQARGASQFKVWQNMQDERVRDSHDHPGLHGMRIRLNELFTLGSGFRCLVPGDASLPPEDRINCRCYLLFE